MSEVPGDPSVDAPSTPAPPAPAEAAPAEEAQPKQEIGIAALFETGAHFGHQTRRWNPLMKPFIFGARAGVHIIDLDITLPRLVEGLEFIKETVAQGGRILFVSTKRQAQDPIRKQAERGGQFYVNNRWLGGMLTNFRTVKKSIEHFKEQLEILADEEKVSELSKKELSRLNRSVTKYRKSLDGIREMSKLPDALFVIDLNKEHIAIAEARRLGIPVVAIVDTNCSPRGIDFAIPGNDDAIRAIELYCRAASDACLEGAELFNERVTSQEPAPGQAEGTPMAPGRRVVEIKQQPSGGRTQRRQSGGAHSAGPRPQRGRPDAPPAEAGATPATPDAPAPAATTPAPAAATPAPDAPAPAAADPAAPKPPAES
jgi:small subunit ribosomal protein S2